MVAQNEHYFNGLRWYFTMRQAGAMISAPTYPLLHPMGIIQERSGLSALA